jgi:hypothetical protein
MAERLFHTLNDGFIKGACEVPRQAAHISMRQRPRSRQPATTPGPVEQPVNDRISRRPVDLDLGPAATRSGRRPGRQQRGTCARVAPPTQRSVPRSSARAAPASAAIRQLQLQVSDSGLMAQDVVNRVAQSGSQMFRLVNEGGKRRAEPILSIGNSARWHDGLAYCLGPYDLTTIYALAIARRSGSRDREHQWPTQSADAATLRESPNFSA